MKNLKRAMGALAIAFVGYLLLAPTQNDPVSWDAPAAPSLTVEPYKDYRRPISYARIPDPENPAAKQEKLIGPETISPTQDGKLIAGLKDGRIMRFSLDGDHAETLTVMQGRPLGLAQRGEGSLVIANAPRGLLLYDLTSKETHTLVDSFQGRPLSLPNSVAVSADGRYAYFTESSAKWGFADAPQAILEHGGDGRLLRYDFEAKTTDVLLNGLQFANGVALGPNEDFLLVVETGAYRVRRYWLNGPRAGQDEIFLDNLPGLPDNITFNGKDRFWLAFYAPRDPLLDMLANKPFIRKMIARLIRLIPPPTKKHGVAIAFSLKGDVVAALEGEYLFDYAPMTHVVETGEWLIFGSSDEEGAARVLVSSALPKQPSAMSSLVK